MKLHYRPEVDGLRAVAVLAVILFHAKFEAYGTTIAAGGYLGVDVFLVISGYLITSIILKELANHAFSLSNFYERRCRRILPALFVVIAATVPLAWFFMPPDAMEEYAGALLSSLFFSSNFWFWHETNYMASPSLSKPLLHTWSLSLEEQFYILFPLFLLIVVKRLKANLTVALTLVFVASLAAAQYGCEAHPEAGFFLLHARAWEFLSGAFLAKLERDLGGRPEPGTAGRFMPSIGMMLLVGSFLLFDEATPHPSLLTLVPVVATVLVLWFSSKNEVVTRVLGSRPFRAVGLISYGLYLWHFPLLAFARLKAPPPTDGEKAAWIGVSFLLATLMYFLIERPARNRERLAIKPLLVSLATAGVVLCVAGTTMRFDTRAVNRYDMPEFHWGEGVRQFQCLLQYKTQTDHAPACYASRTSDNVVLWGDSHAAALYPGLKSQLGDAVPLTQLTQSGCPPLLGLTRLVHRKNCNEVNEKILAFIEATKPHTIILHAAWSHPHYPLSDDEIAEKLAEVITRIRAPEDYRPRIVVVGPVPRWLPDGPAVFLSTKSLRYAEATTLTQLDERMEATTNELGAVYISSLSHLCIEPERKRCIITVDGTAKGITALDSGHLTAAGADYLAAQIKPLLLADDARNHAGTREQ